MDGDLRRKFREALRAWHWQSIESGGTGSGIPDSNFCYAGREGWVEFKRTRGWVVGLAPHQVAWIERRCRAGGYCLVAVRQVRAEGDVLHLFSGKQAARLSLEGLRTTPSMGSWSPPWPWAEVGRLIMEGFTDRDLRSS